MKREDVNAFCNERLCPKYQELIHECPRCPISKQCSAGYHVKGYLTTGDFILWLDKYHDELVAAIKAVMDDCPA